MEPEVGVTAPVALAEAVLHWLKAAMLQGKLIRAAAEPSDYHMCESDFLCMTKMGKHTGLCFI